MNGISTLFSAFGLSTASGLNAYVPLLVVGVIGRYAPQLLHLNAPFDLLTNPWVLIILGIIAILDFVGDKIPALDHLLHTAGVIINPLAGVIVALAANSNAGSVNPIFLAVCGLVLAGVTHATRATVRPVATATTAGVGNPILSFAEDTSALVLSILAIFVPLLAFICVLIFAVLMFWFLRSLLSGQRGNARRR